MRMQFNAWMREKNEKGGTYELHAWFIPMINVKVDRQDVPRSAAL